MGLKKTKYEDTENQNVRFDFSKFDYFYDTDTFPTDAETDFEDIIDDHGREYTIIRQTDTVDNMGRVTATSESSNTVNGFIRDISKKDRQNASFGLAVPGDRTFYIAEESNSFEIKEGDLVVDENTYRWKIVSLLKEPYICNNQVYKRAVIRSTGLEGSS